MPRRRPAIESEPPPPAASTPPDGGAGRYSLVAPRRERTRAPQRRPLTVLVLEAAESVGRFVLDILSIAGHAPMHARSVAEARLRLEEARFDLVMLDLQLDGESCTELLSELTATSEPPAIIVVSSYRLAEPIAREHGVSFVRKPFDVADLIDAIERAVFERPSIAP